MIDSIKHLLLGITALISGFLPIGSHHQSQIIPTPTPNVAVNVLPSPTPPKNIPLITTNDNPMQDAKYISKATCNYIYTGSMAAQAIKNLSQVQDFLSRMQSAKQPVVINVFNGVNSDGSLLWTVQVAENHPDHLATFNWYYINGCTENITDFNGTSYTNNSIAVPAPLPTTDDTYQYPSRTPYQYQFNTPTPTPTPDGLQGQIQLHSDYAGGLVGQDSNGNQVHLHSNYAGGYQGEDSNGNQVHLNPNYAGGYNGTNGTDSINNTFHCNPNYANGYNCN